MLDHNAEVGKQNWPSMGSILATRKTIAEIKASQSVKAFDFEQYKKEQPLLADLLLTPHEDDDVKRAKVVTHILKKSGYQTLKPLLPLMLQLKGKPYNIRNYFPFEPIFRTRTPKRMLLKTARQVSKCITLAGKNRILLANGRLVDHTEVEIGQEVVSYVRFRTTYSRITNKFYVGEHESFKVKTRTGIELEVAGTHPFRTLDGWKPLSELAAGSRIAITARGGKFTNTFQPSARIKCTAYMLAAGHFPSRLFPEDWYFTSSRSEVLDDFSVLASVMQPNVIEYIPKKSRKPVRITLSPKNKLIQFFEEDGLAATIESKRFIPAWVFDLKRKDTVTFIATLWQTAGYTAERPGVPAGCLLSYRTMSKRLAEDLRFLLLKLGINSIVLPARKKNYEIRYSCDKQAEESWEVKISGDVSIALFIRLFGHQIAINESGKKSRRKKHLDEDIVPHEIEQLLNEVQKKIKNRRFHKILSGQIVTYTKLAKLVAAYRLTKEDIPELEILEEILKKEVLWDRIVSIEPVGKVECWDIEVENTHNYVLNGLVCHNSTNLASLGVVFHQAIPHFTTLYITPLFEMIRRFSQNYVRPFLETSPLLSRGQGGPGSVLQRDFINRSKMLFTFAFLDAERTRGVAADAVNYDEIQNLNIDFLPVIDEVMSGSPWQLVKMAGTPKTHDNTIERLWQDSSMAEWLIKCPHGGCGHWNIPALEYDIVDMIGPLHDFISDKTPGVVCAKCRKSINPRPPSQGGTGRWEHRHPERRWSFPGYHVPQLILPMHYASKDKWEIMLNKQRGMGNVPLHTFFNEVCGESYDSGAKMVSITDLKRAAVLPWENTLEEAKPHIDEYIYRICAVDWGGGGKAQKPGRNEDSFSLQYTSYTSIAIMGMLPNGKIHIIYGFRSLHPFDAPREAKIVLGAISHFNCTHLVHDYTGAGSLRETLIHQAGWPADRIIPVTMRGAARGGIFQFVPATDLHPRSHWQCDKPRSLVTTCHLLKHGGMHTFKYDYKGTSNPGLLHDFLNLIENKAERYAGTDIYTVMRDPAGPDDFAQAVNLGTMLLCHMSGYWPDLAELVDIEMSQDAINMAHPTEMIINQLYGN